MRQFKLSGIYLIKAALFIGAALVFHACEESKTGDLGEINRNFADRTTINADVIYKDSGIVKVNLKAPIIEEYTLIDSPYTIMRKGLDLTFWSAESKKPNYLRADWAKIDDKRNFYEGRGNIVMINNDGDTLRTEKIFWDKQNRKIYTRDTVIISRLDGTKITSDYGMEGTEDFREFTFFQNHGVINADRKSNGNSSTSNINDLDKLPTTDKKPVYLDLKEKDSQ
ncbi:LPS export ABC transporter periplasmic protein LptC [Weeksellaceae bacterium TAE3-ERU29]|nr:LPS export ABC transporter periplasmic protein LptC [Weeksellaceae bacterium TAE3-ERU29]